jgi:transcriptional regulator with XRE-family HTH domain
MPDRSDPLDVAVGARISARRLQLGMSQTKLADALGITFQQVQKYERGEKLASRGAFDLLDAYAGIADADVRRALLQLAKTLAASARRSAPA